ncbi:MAG: GntR family transcriptional regulator [Candidatus Dormibacteraeota bacterium]|nr:GntR family transcriptional regulator [Candidatus Dormibacteraeota bacterium]
MTGAEWPPTPIAAVQQVSLSEEVTARIREGIVTGLLRPGQHLREADLADALQVSRSPVRDAFARLNHEGLVTLRRHRGAVVVGMSAEDIEDLYSLRRSLETLAVRLAASRATAEDLGALRAAAAHVQTDSEMMRERQFAEADIRFHDLLYRAAHHDRLYACWSMVRPNIFRFLLTRNIANADYKAIFKDEHSALAQAVADSHPDAAIHLIDDHLQGSYVRLVRHYAPQPEDGRAPGAQERQTPLL